MLKGKLSSFLKKLNGEKRSSITSLQRLKKDGNIINVSVTLSRFWKHLDNLELSQLIVRDVTERKRAEEALREARRACAGFTNLGDVRHALL